MRMWPRWYSMIPYPLRLRHGRNVPTPCDACWSIGWHTLRGGGVHCTSLTHTRSCRVHLVRRRARRRTHSMRLPNVTWTLCCCGTRSTVSALVLPTPQAWVQQTTCHPHTTALRSLCRPISARLCALRDGAARIQQKGFVICSNSTAGAVAHAGARAAKPCSQRRAVCGCIPSCGTE